MRRDCYVWLMVPKASTKPLRRRLVRKWLSKDPARAGQTGECPDYSGPEWGWSENLQAASDDYEETKAQLVQIGHDLERINLSAARSLTEGLEETLTLHRIGLKELFGKSFSTTNIIENLNSQMGRYLRKEFGATVSLGSLCASGDRRAHAKGYQR